MPDYRATLEQLNDAWATCQSCDLGVYRNSVDGQFVFGEGAPRGIMFIGEGPGETEEKEGRPFVGKSGQVLRNVINKLGLTNYYITNLVCCRSCSHAHDANGQPMYRKERRTGEVYPLIKDEPPTPLQVASCMPRLQNEIYLVDPVLIVALGAEAAKALYTKKLAITQVRGEPMPIEVPGAWVLPSLTAKKQVWLRKAKGEVRLPVIQNTVRYLMLPTLHPAFVLRKWADKSHGNAFDRFVQDMKLAAAIYDRYLMEVYGINPAERELTAADLLEGID